MEENYLPANDCLKTIDVQDLNAIKIIAIENCKDCIGGIWKQVNDSQFQLEKLS
jgi:hypothetical protein